MPPPTPNPNTKNKNKKDSALLKSNCLRIEALMERKGDAGGQWKDRDGEGEKLASFQAPI